MLGEDNSTALDKLAKYTGNVPWKYLSAHYLSGVLYYVDPALTLAQVGYAFSENFSGQVDEWLKSGDLVKIGALHAEQWARGHEEFEALVVSPFVLCRPV